MFSYMSVICVCCDITIMVVITDATKVAFQPLNLCGETFKPLPSHQTFAKCSKLDYEPIANLT